jgi:hypothetical protein
VIFSSESPLAASDINAAHCLCFGFDGTTNGVGGLDVYLRDRLAGTTEAVSIVDGTVATHAHPSIGSIVNGLRHPGISRGAAGFLLGRSIYESGPNAARYVLFDSIDQLAPEDDNACIDVYLRDRLLGRTILVSRQADPRWDEAACVGAVGHEISADGERILFASIDPGFVLPEQRTGCAVELAERTFETCPVNVLEYEVATGEIKLVNRGIDGRNAGPLSHLAFFVDQGDPLSSLDDPDRPNPYVGFYSISQQLVEDDEDAFQDLFITDKNTGFVQRGLAIPSFSSIDSLSVGGVGAICTQDPLDSDDDNGSIDVLLSALDMSDPKNVAEDLNSNGNLNDGFFQVFDLRDDGASSTSLLGFFGGAVAPDGAEKPGISSP